MSLVAEQLAGEGAFADAAGVGLHDADAFIELELRNAGADGRVGRESGGRGGVGVNAEVDIAQCAELSLEHDGLAGLHRIGEVHGRVAHIVGKGLAVLFEPCHDLVNVYRLVAVAAGDGEVFPLDDIGNAAAQVIEVFKVAHAQRLFHELIGIDRRNAAACRAELLVAEPVLFQAVKELVIGHADGRAVADLEICRAYCYAAGAQTRGLIKQVLKVDDYAGAEDINGVVAKDAGRQQVQDELALVVYHGVACVVAALIADNDVVIFREQIDHAALALIAPVCSHDCS